MNIEICEPIKKDKHYEVDYELINKAILNHIERTKFPKSLLLNKIKIVLEKNKKVEKHLSEALKNMTETISELQQKNTELKLNNAKVLNHIRSTIFK